MDKISGYLSLSPELLEKIVISILLLIILTASRFIFLLWNKKKNSDSTKAYKFRRVILHTYHLLVIVLIGRIWVEGIDSISTFLGLTTAGLAISMHETISNLAGWFFVIWYKPFKLGDRVQIGQISGDVVDIRSLQFSIVEIGNWVKADQSTGRIIHIPNSKVMKEPLCNYHTGFNFIWHEISLVLTFESNWQKAKNILSEITEKNVMDYSRQAEEELKQAKEKFFIYYGKLTPIVYTEVCEHGVKLTMRFMIDPRKRRVIEVNIWESILEIFAKHDDIEFAYPTTRFFTKN